MPPNRGQQLFVLSLEEDWRWRAIPITRPLAYVYQRFRVQDGTYDFVSARLVARPAKGWKVRLTRHVMKSDYIPRTEESELAFPYLEQPRYHPFDSTYIAGFYRNSPNDIRVQDFGRYRRPNQAIQPTASPRTASVLHD